MKNLKLNFTAGLLLLSLSSSISAERIEVLTLYPAQSLDASDISSISVESLAGNEGGALAFQIEKKLKRVKFDKQPYFELVSSQTAQNPDAILTGAANSNIEEYNVTRKKRVCVERGDDNECKTYQQKPTKCLARNIIVRAQLKLSLFDNGRTVYSDEKSDEVEQIRCKGDADFGSSTAVINDILSNISYAVRRDLAPATGKKFIKVLEKRKGMEKAFGKEFKASVKLTKTDVDAACDQWKTMSETVEHGSILYNLGICEERKGNLPYALSYYSRSLPMVKSQRSVNESIARVESHIEAKEQYAAREAYLNDKFSNDVAVTPQP